MSKEEIRGYLFKHVGLERLLERVEWGLAVSATLVAIGFLIEFVRYAPGLWRDEINSVNIASAQSVSEMWRLDEFDSFPLSWTMLLRLWMTVLGGSTDLSLRIFGLLGGLALIAAVWFMTRRLGQAVPLASIALLAVNPAVIRGAASVRAWGVGTFFTVVTVVLIYEAAMKPSYGKVLLAVLAGIFSVQCVYQNAAFLISVTIAMFISSIPGRNWRRGVVPLVAGGAAALSLFPYVGTIQRIRSWDVLNQSPVNAIDFLVGISEYVAGSGIVVFALWVAVIAIAIVAGIHATSARDNTKRHIVMYCASVLVVSSVSIALFYCELSRPFHPWYYLGLVTLTAGCAETAIVTSLRTPLIRSAIIAFSVVVLAFGISPAWASLTSAQTNLDVIAAELGHVANRNDVVVVSPWFLSITFDHYYKGQPPVRTIPPIEDRRVHRFDLVKAIMLSRTPLAAIESEAETVLRSGHRVWIVCSFQPGRLIIEPLLLAVPPLADSGWNVGPYQRSWSLQFHAFLQQHAEELRSVPIGRSGGEFENGYLFVANGWR
jgi:hypothetical protein